MRNCPKCGWQLKIDRTGCRYYIEGLEVLKNCNADEFMKCMNPKCDFETVRVSKKAIEKMKKQEEEEND